MKSLNKWLVSEHMVVKQHIQWALHCKSQFYDGTLQLVVSQLPSTENAIISLWWEAQQL